jgi:hypothetical protein
MGGQDRPSDRWTSDPSTQVDRVELSGGGDELVGKKAPVLPPTRSLVNKPPYAGFNSNPVLPDKHSHSDFQAPLNANEI